MTSFLYFAASSPAGGSGWSLRSAPAGAAAALSLFRGDRLGRIFDGCVSPRLNKLHQISVRILHIGQTRSFPGIFPWRCGDFRAHGLELGHRRIDIRDADRDVAEAGAVGIGA